MRRVKILIRYASSTEEGSKQRIDTNFVSEVEIRACAPSFSITTLGQGNALGRLFLDSEILADYPCAGRENFSKLEQSHVGNR